MRNLFEQLIKDGKLESNAKSMDIRIFSESIFAKTFDDVAEDCYVEQTEAYISLFQNTSKYNAVRAALAEMLYKEFNKKRL